MNTKIKGECSEAVIFATLVKRGHTVLKPWGDSARYDLVIEELGQFTRVQCKTGYLSKDKHVLKFRTCSVGYKGFEKGYLDQIDAFAIYSPDLDRVYFVPIQDAPASLCYLRLNDTKNGQSKKILKASDYQL
jgi:hypothetical protein